MGSKTASNILLSREPCSQFLLLTQGKTPIHSVPSGPFVLVTLLPSGLCVLALSWSSSFLWLLALAG